MAARLYIELSGPAFSNASPPVPGRRHHTLRQVWEAGEFGVMRPPPVKMWCAGRCPSSELEARHPEEELVQVSRKQLLADSAARWNRRGMNPTTWHIFSGHEEVHVPLCPNNRQKHVWANSASATMGTGLQETQMTRSAPVESRPRGTFVATERYLEVGMCRNLCENGPISDAVNVLDLLVQVGCHVPKSLYHRVLKRCIHDKDLVLGRRIHALAVKSGYQGDPFLATHLIGLYSWHVRLEEAMGVFREVLKPNAYNWAAIISAYARHGEAAQAIRLFRHMCESTAIEPNDNLYSAVLKACAAAKDLVAGKNVHARILACPRKAGRGVQTGLVSMYAKCGSLEDARRIFDSLSDKDVVTWNAMIAGYVKQGMGHEALNLRTRMQRESLTRPNSLTYVSLLQACASIGVGALGEGKQLHADIQSQELQEDEVVGCSLVNMYAKCGRLEEARLVFDKLSNKDVVTWTAMIAGYAQQDRGHEALSLYRSMREEGHIVPNSVTFICLLQACASVGAGALDQGKQLHAQIKEQGLHGVAALGVSLVNMYAKCCCLQHARSLFDKLPEKSIVAWTAMIAGYAQGGMGQEALKLYRSMQEVGVTPNSVTYVCLLQACASVGAKALGVGQQLHAQIDEGGPKDDAVLGSSLVDMYAKCGQLEKARVMFDKLADKRGVVTWTVMIAGYAQQGMVQEALSLERRMRQEGLSPPDAVTYSCLLQACASDGVKSLEDGKQLHARIREQGLQEDGELGVSLVNMYAKCGSLEDASSVFYKLRQRNVVAWTAMIAGYVQHGMGREALNLYTSMKQQGGLVPDAVTYVALLQGCASLGASALYDGQELHAEIRQLRLEKDGALGVSLVNMYAKCGSIEDARRLFDQLALTNVVAWNAIIAGYVQQGMGEEALNVYSRMRHQGDLTPNSVTYVCLLQACADVAALALGEQLHAEMEECGMTVDGITGAALVHMYAKCGSMCDSQRVLDSMSQRSIEAWGALVSGYARQGNSEAVFDSLDRMVSEGIHPDGDTFVSVLTVCSHAGLVDKGRKCYDAMQTDYGIDATTEHLTCMVDLLGRAGHLHDALQVAKTMPAGSSNYAVWQTLLGACQTWKDVEIGRQAFEGAISVDETEGAAYVLLSNIYASRQMWEAADEIQARRMRQGARKKPGQSWWVDMNGLVHVFLVGDKKHVESENIQERLEQLTLSQR